MPKVLNKTYKTNINTSNSNIPKQKENKYVGGGVNSKSIQNV